MSLGRIKAAIANHGGRSESDWLSRAIPFPGASFPVPKLNDTVCIIYKDGDPHQGFYLGVVQNLINPAGDIDSLILDIPKDTIASSQENLTVIAGESISFICGNVQIKIQNGTIDITGASSVTINGKEIATIGAKDTRNDTLITKGWT